MNRPFKLKSLACALALTIIGCQPEDPIDQLTVQHQTEDVGASLKLGKKLENPYSVENMRKALTSLNQKNKTSKNTYKGKVFSKESDIQATHYYVRFLPKNSNQLEKLEEKDQLELFNTPLDVEILEEGEEPYEELENEGIWQYTAVPVDYRFRQNIEYEILEELFLTDENEEGKDSIKKVNGIANEFLNDLEDEALRITNNFEETDEEIDETAARRPKRRPQGTIRVRNTATGDLDPVVGVKVKTRRWFKFGKGWTNEDGFYRINKRYRRNVRYTVVFKNRDGFKVWRSIVAISSARHRAGKHSNRGHDMDFEQGRKRWRWATVNNGTLRYLHYCEEFGIGKPPRKLRIAALNGGGSSSAPMLRRTWGVFGLTSNNDVISFLAKANSLSIALNKIAVITKFIQPDLIIKTGDGRGTEQIYEVLFHELAHASHWSKVRSKYWVKYINYIITYGPYGDGTGNNHGIPALGETWGFHTGQFLTLEEFGPENNEVSPDIMENYLPLNRGIGDGVDRFRINGRLSSAEGWMPIGIMHDLMDNNGDILPFGLIDRVNGFTMQQLYDSLDEDVESPTAYFNRLVQENPEVANINDVRNLFIAYFWLPFVM